MFAALVGSPIGFSKSPLLHMAGYRELGLDWEYYKYDLSSFIFLENFLGTVPESCVGLSVTMPLKKDILKFGFNRSDLVDISGVANTLYWDSRGVPCLENTDIFGITEVLKSFDFLEEVTVLGSGATASSAFLALVGLGVRKVVFFLRDPRQVDRILELGSFFGVETSCRFFGDKNFLDSGVIISTLPPVFAEDFCGTFFSSDWENIIFMDVAYYSWPTPLASFFVSMGARIISGMEMLIYQAAAQVKLFCSNYVEEDNNIDILRIVSSMRLALLAEGQ